MFDKEKGYWFGFGTLEIEQFVQDGRCKYDLAGFKNPRQPKTRGAAFKPSIVFKRLAQPFTCEFIPFLSLSFQSGVIIIRGKFVKKMLFVGP